MSKSEDAKQRECQKVYDMCMHHDNMDQCGMPMIAIPIYVSQLRLFNNYTSCYEI